MIVSKRGPKTESGKRKSAKNSTTHGARSQVITSPKEQVHFDGFLKELIDFYQPQGPIEQMQLERIATCKTKLKSLYELEQAKLALLIDQHKDNTDQYISEFSDLSPLVLGMIRELFFLETLGLPDQVCLPCQLTIQLLSDIVAEIDSFVGVLASDDELRDYFPQLVAYLNGLESREAALHARLLGISHQLEKVINDKDYYEAVKLIFHEKFQEVIPEPTPEELDFDRQVELHQKKQANSRNGIKVRAKTKVVIKDSAIEFPDQEKLTSAFKTFKSIHQAYLMALETAESVRSRIQLHERALSLPNDEADLLMRYQTSWERRLSTLIGEFMQLRRMRLLEANS